MTKVGAAFTRDQWTNDNLAGRPTPKKGRTSLSGWDIVSPASATIRPNRADRFPRSILAQNSNRRANGQP
jgi:hypothetical protein